MKQMKKFTNSENAKRKLVFTYNRKKQLEGGEKYRDSCTKKFGRSKLAQNAIVESNRRIERSRDMPSEQELFREKVIKHCNGFASCLPSSGYSMGEHKFIYCKHLGEVNHSDNTEEYAKSCSWRARHGIVKITLPIRLLMNIENMSGMLTIRGKQIQNRIWKCKWIVFDYQRNGRGIINGDLGYHLVNGYVVYRKSAGYFSEGWYHSESLADSRQKLYDYLIYEKNEDVRKKEQMHQDAIHKKARAKEERQLGRLQKRIEKSKELKDALTHMYVYADSIKAGNCVPGTNGFLKDHNLLKTDSRSGEFLLRISRKSWQHNHVVRILCQYLSDNYPEFYKVYRGVVETILQSK